jgi:hypothetical protein
MITYLGWGPRSGNLGVGCAGAAQRLGALRSFNTEHNSNTLDNYVTDPDTQLQASFNTEHNSNTLDNYVTDPDTQLQASFNTEHNSNMLAKLGHGSEYTISSRIHPGNAPIYNNLYLRHVFQIHDILVRIQIRGSVPLTNRSGSGSGSCSFHQWSSSHQQNVFTSIFCLMYHNQISVNKIQK